MTGSTEGNGSGAWRFEPPLSAMANAVVRNPIRKVALKLQETPGCISLAGGRPPPCVFPPCARAVGDDLMNYGPQLAVGCPELRAWARGHIEKVHSPPGGWENRDLLITSGNTDGMTKTVMLLCDPGDIIVADEMTYPGILASALPLGRRVLGVRADAEGMVPEALVEVLEEASAASVGASNASGAPGAGRARILYLTPHGQNPTGVTLSKRRKLALYAIARKYELTILEDDPYIFVSLRPPVPGAGLEPADMRGSGAAPESFLSMDTDGRVVRLDSCSKMLAPGFRLGWVTAGKAMLAKWAVLGEVLTWSISGVQQRTLLTMLQEWGDEGFCEHLQRLQSDYAKRCQSLVQACEKHLKGLCRWQVPDFGMFFWLEVLGIEDTAAIVDELIESYGIAMVPGAAFSVRGGSDGQRSNFFRVSFSLLTAETADKAMGRLREFLEAKAAAAGAAGGEGERGGEAAAKRGRAAAGAPEDPAEAGRPAKAQR